MVDWIKIYVALRARCILIATLLLASAALAQQPLKLGAPPGGGQRVPEYLMAPRVLLGQIANSNLYNGVPVIMYDAYYVTKYGGITSAAFRFMRAHEYAHHRRGHVLAAYMTGKRPGFNFRAELEADCDAARYLGNDRSAIEAGVAVYKAEVIKDDDGENPGHERRERNIRDCASSSAETSKTQRDPRSADEREDTRRECVNRCESALENCKEDADRQRDLCKDEREGAMGDCDSYSGPMKYECRRAVRYKYQNCSSDWERARNACRRSEATCSKSCGR